MSSLKAKLAALRAKRAAHLSNPSPSPSDTLTVAALALGQPQASWDEDYKDRLQENETSPDVKPSADSPCSSDEDGDEDELVVLPPPTRKLNPAAQRQMWRMKEIGRAQEKAARHLMHSRPESFEVDDIPIEKCPEDPDAAEEPDQPADAEEDGAEDAQDAQDREEEDSNPQEGHVNDDPEQDEEEAALETAQRIEEEEIEDALDEFPLRPDADAEKAAAKIRPSISSWFSRPKSRDRKKIPEAQHKTGTGGDERSPKASDDTSGSSPNRKPSKGEHAVAAHPAPEQSNEIVEDVPKKNIVRCPQEQRFRTGFVEEEADDDEEADEENRGSRVRENDGEVDPSNEDADDDDEGIVQDFVDPSDNKKLAVFHQKWMLEKEQDDLNALKKPQGRMMVNDLDDAMDLTELAQTGATAEDGNENDNASEAGEGVSIEDDFAADDQAKSNNYVNEMFLRDDSRSKFVDDGNEEEEENEEYNISRREKARALWKARQKTKISLFQEDENSLSRFDIFGDTDKSRSTHFRKKLENACRPVSQKDLDDRSRMDLDRDNGAGSKRTSVWNPERSVPEWEKRNACIQQKQRKRQRSVSVGNWSFAAHGEKEKVSSKMQKTGSSSAGRASLGSTYLARKSRSHKVVPNKRRASSGAPPKTTKPSSSKGPTSFKGLLSLLGNRAETDL